MDFKLTPNFEGKLVGEYKVDVKINSDGLRDYEHNLTSNNFRILALGDSFTFGDGVDIDNTFVSILEKQLDVEIIKAGIPAYGQDNQLYYFITKGRDYNPDITIIFYYLNDNGDNNDITDRKVAYGNLIQRYRYNSLPNWKLYAYTKLYRTGIVRLLREASFNLIAYFNKNKEADIEYRLFLKNQTKESSEWAETTALFEKFGRIAENSKLLIVYVPDKKQIYPDEFLGYFDINTDVDKPNKILKDIAESFDIAFIDITKEMRDLNTINLYFKYNTHFNERGHKLFATLVSNELIKHIEA